MFTAVGLSYLLLRAKVCISLRIWPGPRAYLNHSQGHRKGGASRGAPQRIKNNREVPRSTLIL